MAETTTVFQSGNSQAVRLPKEHRFKSRTVKIFRRGDEVVLREKPIGHNDMWLAAHALAEQVTIVTGNEREFRRVPGLVAENWLR